MKEVKLIKTSIIQFKSKENEWNNILLKNETEQLTGAFKIRGVSEKFKKIDLEKYDTIITASTGNHGQAVALCSKNYNKNCIIIVPKNTPKCKIDKISQYNPTIYKELENYDECKKYAIELSKNKGYYYIPSFDDINIINGHKTLFEEIDWTGIDYCFCPIGGGGLISACLEYLQETNVKVIGVEMEKMDAMRQSLEAQKSISVNINNNRESFAEGILVSEVGETNLEIAKKHDLEVCTVSEEEIKNAIKTLYTNNGIKAEGAGASALAGALKYNKKGKNCICIISGGNIDDRLFNKIIEG